MEVRCCQGCTAEANRQTDICFPRLNLTGLIFKTDCISLQIAAPGNVVVVEQGVPKSRPIPPTSDVQGQTDTDMYRKLVKKTDHFNSGHDGLIDDITVGRCTAWVLDAKFALARLQLVASSIALDQQLDPAYRQTRSHTDREKDTLADSQTKRQTHIQRHRHSHQHKNVTAVWSAVPLSSVVYMLDQYRDTGGLPD